MVRNITFPGIWVFFQTLLVGSMYSWYWLIQLYRSDKYNGKFARTGISTLNGHICGHGHGGHGHGGHGHDGQRTWTW